MLSLLLFLLPFPCAFRLVQHYRLHLVVAFLVQPFFVKGCTSSPSLSLMRCWLSHFRQVSLQRVSARTNMYS